jgi:hypothetical protein
MPMQVIAPIVNGDTRIVILDCLNIWADYRLLEGIF